MDKNTSLHATPPYSQPTTINMLSYAESAPTSSRLTSGATSSFSGIEDELTRKRNKLPSLTDRMVVTVEGNDSVVTENSTPRTSMSSYRRPVDIYRYRTERERKGKVFYRTLVGVSGVTTVFLVTWLPVLSQLLLAVLSQSVNILPPLWLDKVVLFATEIAVWCNLFVYWTVRWRADYTIKPRHKLTVPRFFAWKMSTCKFDITWSMKAAHIFLSPKWKLSWVFTVHTIF